MRYVLMIFGYGWALLGLIGHPRYCRHREGVPVMKYILALALAIVLPGCATNGEQPAYVKHLKYTTMAERDRDAYYRRANNEYLRRER